MGIWYALAGGLTLSAILLSVRFRTLLNRLAAKLEKTRP
jgi:Na+-driven multidrug efflux pump